MAATTALLLAGCPGPTQVQRPSPVSPPSDSPGAAGPSSAQGAVDVGPPPDAGAPLALQSPFAPVVGPDGAPPAVEVQIAPVVVATLMLAPAHPSWRIGRLDAARITWDVLPVQGLPPLTAWDSAIGRYPDALWMRVGNASGGLDWYRWRAGNRAWARDEKLEQGRRTAAWVIP